MNKTRQIVERKRISEKRDEKFEKVEGKKKCFNDWMKD